MKDTTTMPIQFLHDISHELRNAMAWYDFDDQVKNSNFRSDYLKTQANKAFPKSCHTTYSELVQQGVQGLLDARRGRVEGKLVTSDEVDKELHRSNSLLVVDWESSLFDGAVTPETDGFIDDYCMPGWDSWLGLAEADSSHGEKCLVCWVPEHLSARVNFGIEVDAASCMSWLRHSEVGKLELIGWGDTSE